MAGVAPSFLSVGQSEALGSMGAFVLVFVIRMAGATIEQKEEAEASMRASEERFRSLVQNSTDSTLVMGADGGISYASPATASLLGRGARGARRACAPPNSCTPKTAPGWRPSWPRCSRR